MKLEKLEYTKRAMMLENSQKDLYYAYFLMATQIEARDVQTACAFINGYRFGIAIDPTFWNPLPEKHKIGILKHEVMHIIFSHVKLFHVYKEREIFNISADFTINTLIGRDYLPEGALFPEDFEMSPGVKWPTDKDTLWYYTEMLKQKQNGTMTQGMKDLCDSLGGEEGTPGWMSDHDWDKMKEEMAEKGDIIDTVTKGDIKRLYEETVQKGRGTLPGMVEQFIKSLFKINPPVVNWKKELRQFTASRKTTKKTFTRIRESKRYDESPGFKKKRKRTVAVIIDTSGSVSDKELCDFFSEVHHIYKSDTRLEIIECDTQVNRTWWYEGKWNLKCMGRAATYLSPAIDYVNKKKEFNVCVVFTDGGIESNPTNCRVPSLWIISSRGTSKINVKGRIIKM